MNLQKARDCKKTQEIPEESRPAVISLGKAVSASLSPFSIKRKSLLRRDVSPEVAEEYALV